MKFEPTAEMIEAAANVFIAMAALGVIEPIVTGYETEILKKHQWTIRPEFQKRLGAEIVLDPKNAYLMSDADQAVFFAEAKLARQASGLVVEHDEQCPKCVAEYNLIEAKHKLIEVMEPITKLSVQRLMCGGLDKYEEAVELTLKLLGPFVAEVMPDAMKGLAPKTAAKADS